MILEMSSALMFMRVFDRLSLCRRSRLDVRQSAPQPLQLRGDAAVVHRAADARHRTTEDGWVHTGLELDIVRGAPGGARDALLQRRHPVGWQLDRRRHLRPDYLL